MQNNIIDEVKNLSKPIVAIVGRPNVGKSTFFNQIGKKRVSIVEDFPGVTRDRIYMDAEWLNHQFTMIDTGGIELENDGEGKILASMRQQARLAIEEADVIVFMVDGSDSACSCGYPEGGRCDGLFHHLFNCQRFCSDEYGIYTDNPA